MGNASFNQDWYGMQAKVLAQSDDRVVVDYGCKGRGIVKNYNLFEGILIRNKYSLQKQSGNILFLTWTKKCLWSRWQKKRI